MKKKILSILLSTTLILHSGMIPQISAISPVRDRHQKVYQNANPNGSPWVSRAAKYVIGSAALALAAYGSYRLGCYLRQPDLPYIDIHESNSPEPYLENKTQDEDRLNNEAKVNGAIMSRYAMLMRVNDYHGCYKCNSFEGLTYSQDPLPDSVEIWSNSTRLVLPHEIFNDEESALEQCRIRLGLYGLKLSLVDEHIHVKGKRIQYKQLIVQVGENLVTLSKSQRPDGTCVPIYCQFGNHIYKIHIFITSRDARYIRSEISKLFALLRQEIKIENRAGLVLHDFGDDQPGEQINEGVGTLDNPIIVRLSNDPTSRARIAYEEGFFGNRPVAHDARSVFGFLRNPSARSVFDILKDPNASEFQKTLVAARYLHDAWKDRPAVIERRNDMRRIIAIGDIHANAYLIPQIDAIIRNNPDASIVFTGDYVDRGAPNPNGSENGIQNNIEVLCAMALWQHEFPDRVTFLRGNHETREVNQGYGLHFEMQQKFGDIVGSDVWEAINLAFDELPIAAWLGKCFACHGGVPKDVHDLIDIQKGSDETLGINERNFLWSDILFNIHYTNSYSPSGRGSGCGIGQDRQVRIFEDLRYNGALVRPELFLKGHQHELGSQIYVGKYSDGTHVAIMCTIGSYSQKRSDFGYWDIDQEAGTEEYTKWAVTPPPPVIVETS
jgi:hypothetical protein